MAPAGRRVELYALSTCVWCRRTREWLEQRAVPHEVTYVDLAGGEELARAQRRVLEFVSNLSFPVLIIDDGRSVLQGYQPDRFEDELG